VVYGLTDLRITLRPARADDRPFLQALYASTREAELALLPWPEAEKAAFVRQQFDAQDSYYRRMYPDARFEIVTIDGQAVGRWYVAELPQELRLVDVILSPDARGQGAGTALLTALCEEADAKGLPVRLHVEPWSPARRLYERLGFVPIEVHGIHELMERRAPS
jgi:RimJ/RimL family protein N-acetyltransferase